MKTKTKTFDNFQEEQRIKEQKEREKKEAENYFYLDFQGISDECYSWWKVVLKSYDYKEHDRIPVCLKELFQKW